MKKINVSGCIDCPFRGSEFNDYAVGFDSIDSCELARFFNYKDNIIVVYNMCDEDSKLETPKWCPLKENTNININFISNGKK